MDEWLEFKTGQYPRIGEVIAVKGCAGIYRRLLKVAVDEHNCLQYHWLGDGSTVVCLDYGVTHWKLVDIKDSGGGMGE